MNRRHLCVLSIIVIMLSILTAIPSGSFEVAGVPNPRVASPDPPPVVGIWSIACQSFVIASNNTSCGDLSVGKLVSVQINVTGAPIGSVNGYDIYLSYDQNFLTAKSADVKTGTVFAGAVQIANQLDSPGQVREAAVCIDQTTGHGCYNSSTTGVLFSISFNIIKNGVSPISLAAGMVPSGFAQSYTELTTPAGLAPTTADGYFINVAGNPGPVSSFTFSPKVTVLGQAIFDATASFDPDALGAPNKGIDIYNWDFGGATGGGPVHFPTNIIRLGSVDGNFSVRLTVVDKDNGFAGMQTRLFTISKKPLHDLVAQTISPNPRSAHPGDKVTVSVLVANNGTFFEQFKLVVSFSPPSTIIGTKSNESIKLGETPSFTFTWDTTGLSPGFYSLTENVTVLPSSYNPTGFDNITRNNAATTQVQILGTETFNSSLLIIAGGALAGVVALATAGLLLRKRRAATASR